ncbi:MAG: tetratricopeptide repeat protein, partial [Verrucomicrobiota bacterium]
RLYERGGQREKAVQLYEHRRTTEPENLDYLRSLASLYKSAKQTEQAIEVFKTLLEKDKNRARVYQKELLDIYLSVDLKDEAIAAAQQIVSLASSDPEARLALAQVYQLYRQPDKAMDEYRYALRLEPNEPDYYRQYGEALESEKRFGEAQETFRKMLDVSKEDSTRLSSIGNLARIYLQQDQLDALVGEFSRRIRNTPKKLAAYEELAAIYKESGQIFKSVEVLESGLQTVDEKPAALKALVRTAFEAQDFGKVRSYYEQLVEISGKPTAQEFEKLGQIYAQLGEIEKAKETWNKILMQAPKDAKAADKVSSLLRNQGFTDEALLVKAKAVELDAKDYRRRFEYAQLLAQADQPVEAMTQLNFILEIGEGEEAKKKEEEKEKKVKRLTKGNPQNMNRAYQFMYGSQNYRSYNGNQSWQGSFKNFRPQLLQYMTSLGQQSIGEEAFVEQFKNRLKKHPNDMDAKRDLLTVLEMYNQMDEALALAEEILATAPDDVELLQRTALLYSNEQKIDKAIALLEKLAKAQPKERLAAAQGLVPLYLKNKQEEKGLQLIDQILAESGNDVQTLYAMGYLLQQNTKYDQAKKVFEKIIEVDPNQRDTVRNQLAALAKQSGKLDEAQKLYREIFNPRQRVDIYVPSVNPNNQRSYQNPMQSLPQNALGYIDYWKTEAFSQAKQGDKSKTNATSIVVEMEKVARDYKTSALPATRNRAWESARLLTAHYVVEKEFDKASDLLEVLNKAGMDDVGLYNASLYVAQQKEDYPAMIALYEKLQQRYPAKTRDIALAKTSTLLIAKKYEEAAKSIAELSQQRVPPATILGLIQSLATANEKKLAKKLLEEHLTGVSRSSQALEMLAQIHAGDNEYDAAIALASEAWERKAHGKQTANFSYYGSQPYYSPYGQTDNLLQELQRYYVAAGKSDELIAKFKERLEKQPGSVQAHENLAELYRLGNQREKALEIY